MNIKQLREKKGLTQQQVADMIGVDVATYNRYERGKYKIGRTVQLALSVALGVPVEDIKKSKLRT
jgi:transcriptional regulator with XRE-family HTH domain